MAGYGAKLTPQCVSVLISKRDSYYRKAAVGHRLLLAVRRAEESRLLGAPSE
jgi:hypothetical protein